MLVGNLDQAVAKVRLFQLVSYVINDCDNRWVSLNKEVSGLVRYLLEDACWHLRAFRVLLPSWDIRHRFQSVYLRQYRIVRVCTQRVCDQIGLEVGCFGPELNVGENILL